MDEPEIITATEASRAFSEMLHRVCYGGESFVIKKGNRLMARLVPVELVMQDTTPQVPEPVVQELINESVVQTTSNAHLCDGLTQEEADYYKTVAEQLNRSLLEEV